MSLKNVKEKVEALMEKKQKIGETITTVISAFDSVAIIPDDENLKDFTILMERKNLEGIQENTNMLRIVGSKVSYVIDNIDFEKELIFASGELIDVRKLMVEAIKSGELDDIKAIVPSEQSFKDFGVYLATEFNGETVPLILTNANFSAGPIRCKDILSVNEQLTVVFDKVTSKGEIYVKLKELYEYSNKKTIEQLQLILPVDGLVEGVVSGVHNDRIYVRLASLDNKPIDAICGSTTKFKLTSGSKVVYLIESVVEGDESHPLIIRGRILRAKRD